MTKTTARILALICALGTLFILFQVRIISPAEGKHVLIYSVPGYRNVGASAGQDLEQQLQEKHGEAEPVTDLGATVWKDKDAQLLERIDHEMDVMGVDFEGNRYISCTVRTTRNAVSGEEKILAAADHAVTYIALDPAGEERASVLWDTAQEETSRHWEALQQVKN